MKWWYEDLEDLHCLAALCRPRRPVPAARDPESAVRARLWTDFGHRASACLVTELGAYILTSASIIRKT